MRIDLTSLIEEVRDIKDAEPAIVKLLQGLSGKFMAAQEDTRAIASLAERLDEEAPQLAAACIANTPAAPPSPSPSPGPPSNPVVPNPVKEASKAKPQ